MNHRKQRSLQIALLFVLAALMFLAVQFFVLPSHPVAACRCETEPPSLVSIVPRVPDHPPKVSLEIRV